MQAKLSKRLISKRTVGEFIDAFSDWFVLRDIDKMFGVADVHPKEDFESSHGGQRRSLADSCIASLDLHDPRDAAKLIEVFQQVVEKIEARAELGDEHFALQAKNAIKVLTNVLRLDGYTYTDGIIKRPGGGLGLDDLSKLAETIDLHYVTHQVKRLQEAVESDPEAAIGGAKELIETCCKTILLEEGMEGVDGMEVPKLIKEVTKALKLTPEDVPETARGADAMKRMLGSLSTLAISMAELRSEYGTGHGKHGKAGRPKVRHARLAVGGAATLATFLFETHDIKKKSS